jgi:glycosyltransferase involved in cell wall biosynthesis/peptidoglycan/xylan/chitin deacetylase (PgdA/CDA1 family)
MLRRLARSAIAHGLGRTGADRAIGRLSGVGKEPLILAYHRVLQDSAAVVPRGVPSMGISVSTLERHLEFVGRRFRFVSLDELGARVEKGTASGLAAVTFDDGYADFYENAFPLLQRKGVPAAVFVVTGLLETAGGFLHDRVYVALENALRRWDARRVGAFLAEKGFAVGALPPRAFPGTRLLLRSLDHEALSGICATLELEFGDSDPAPRSLTWDDVARMSRAGLTIGSHTSTHAILTRESQVRGIEETAASRGEIERRLGVPVRHFAYPDGSFDGSAVRAVAAAGYRYAYTGCRHRDPDHPLLTLPRRVLWEGSTLGALGHFAADVLSGQVNGIFDAADRCSEDHGAASASAGRPTTIAVVAPSLDLVGGQSVQAAALVEGLREDGLRVLFLPTNPRFPWALRWLRRVPLARTVLNQALYAFRLARLGRADVVHVFSASFWSFLLAPSPAMLMARLLGKRVVLNYHSGEVEEHLRSWGWFVHPWLQLAHEIVVPSEYLERAFLEHGYRARVVRNVVDVSRFGYRDRSPLLPRLLSTRSLERDYRVDVVLSAFALVKAERPDATLRVAGCGREEGRLRQMAGSMEGVTFLGRVAPEAMPGLCASADIFLNASVVDNQPLSLLEAFASGLPVVTTATGGIAGMLRQGEAGLVVPPLDPAAMARAVLTLLRDEDAALRMARAARRVAETHSWSSVRDQWTEVYSGRSVDAAPAAEDGDRRGRRQEPAGSLEVAGEEGYDESVAAQAR